MRNKTLKNAVLTEVSSIKETMRAIDLSGLRVAYITDKEGRVIGAASDSEIRRAILKGIDISKSVRHIINPHPILLRNSELKKRSVVGKRIRKILERMPDARYVLVIDSEDKPLRLAPCSEFTGKTGEPLNDITPSKHILVVGGAGYLGSVLVRKLLAQGFKVRILDTLMYGRESLAELSGLDNFELIEGDMRNISTLVRSLSGVDAVINLAAIVGDPACQFNPEAAIETNYLANKALAEACKYHQVNRFIYASTCSVYGAMEENVKLDENSPLNPISLYARSKIESEKGILELQDENFSPTILRMSTLYGYSYRMRFDLVVNTMTKTATVDNRITVHGSGEQWRPFLNVEDAASAYVRCLAAPFSKVRGEIFNVGSDKENYKIVDIASAVHRCIPSAQVELENANKDARNYVVAFSKINRRLGYKTFSNLEASIRRIHAAIKTGEIKDLEHPKYYNIKEK